MSALPELQATLGDALHGKGGDALWPLFREPRAVAERRFAAYRRNVIGNWRSALESTYPVLAQRVGPAAFRTLADHYIAAHPSVSGDLNAYGSEMAALLENSALHSEPPYLADLARLEWALLQAYGAPDAAAFDLAALAAVPVQKQAGLRLEVWPGACLIDSSWPLPAIWQAHQLAPDARDEMLSGLDLSSPQPSCTLAARSEGRVYAVALSGGEAAFLHAILRGQPLAEALACALAVDATLNPGAVLHRLIGLHVLTGFRED